MWIGTGKRGCYEAGDKGFLVELHHKTEGWTNHQLRAHPAMAAKSFKPYLYGWVDEHSTITTKALGMVQVVQVAPNGRALVTPLQGDELVAALHEYGYPELIEQMRKLPNPAVV